MLLPSHDVLGWQNRFLGDMGAPTFPNLRPDGLFQLMPVNQVYGSFTSDPNEYTLALNFRVRTTVTARKLIFQRVSADSTTVARTLHLWQTTGGILLASGETTETISTNAKIEVDITPVVLSPGVTYKVSYDKPPTTSAYAFIAGYFPRIIDNYPLFTPQAPNGLFAVTMDTDPTAGFSGHHYGCDLAVSL